MHNKFGRDVRDESTFQVESYLHHQGDSFTRRFDPNSYLYLTKALDLFDLSKGGSLEEGLKDAKADFLVISVSSDWLYPSYQSKELVRALSSNDLKVQYREIVSHYGHDAFLLEKGQLNYLISAFLEHLTVRDVMSTDVPTIHEGCSLEEAAGLMVSKNATHLPILSPGGRITGIVTSWDITLAVASKIASLEDVVSRHIVTTTPEEPLFLAAQTMDKYGVSALPVVDEAGCLVGILSSDIISALVGKKID